MEPEIRLRIPGGSSKQLKSIYSDVPDISISNAQNLVLKNEKVKFNFNPENELKRTPPLESVPKNLPQKNMHPIFRTELPDTTMLENKLGFLGETGGANTYKSEIPIVDWNENYNLHGKNRNQNPSNSGKMISKMQE